MARIAVTDGMDQKAVQRLEKAGHDVVVNHIEKAELLGGALAEFDAIIIRSATKLPAEVIDASGDRLKVIGRAGVGVDNIDLVAAGARGISVVNAPRASTQSVVELTLGHLLASIRHLPRADRSLREGRWDKKALKGSELSGKALGLIGFGRIAQSVGRVAQALGMEVHAYDPYLPPKIAKSQGTRLHKTVDALFSNCTHFSIHCNLTEETHHLVNAQRLASMPHIGNDGAPCGSHIINCARGGIVDEQAVLEALRSGVLTSAALDVFEQEPVDPKHPLLQMERFHGTPHIGASTVEAQARVGMDIATNVLAVLKGRPCDFVVNQAHL
ncbi:MAG: hydroxyacid dehydrogenase [Candidatus Thermoplasmatota archaeon]|nr:hydroxyacid dehydrogenase [Candidatus Thermoplasmatota archaeon]